MWYPVLHSHNRDNGTIKYILAVLFMALIFFDTFKALLHQKTYHASLFLQTNSPVFVISSYTSKVPQIYRFMVLVACFAYMHAEIINIKYRKEHKRTKLTLGIVYGSSVMFCQLKNFAKDWGNNSGHTTQLRIAQNPWKFSEIQVHKHQLQLVRNAREIRLAAFY